ncbi:MAG: hypothetical protein AMXMBFR84_41520 [Candidatus Hydrogenedentota bacterium]
MYEPTTRLLAMAQNAQAMSGTSTNGATAGPPVPELEGKALQHECAFGLWSASQRASKAA